MVTFRAGRLSLDPNAPKPELTPHLCGEGVEVSDSVDYFSHVTNWDALGNLDWGDCTCASDGHIAIQQTAYGLGEAQEVTTAEVLAAYSAISGFDPAAGPPGRNPTDKGATTQAALEYLRKYGIGGFRIAAYGHVDWKDHDAVKHAVEEFGAMSIGVLLPISALSQNGEWTVVPGSPIDGGHCVMVVGYDARWLYVVSWGQVNRMSWEFLDTYCEEAWAIISEYWTPVTGLSLEAFGSEFAAVFGGGNPFAPSVLEDIEVEGRRVFKGFKAWFHRLGYRGAHRL